MTSLVQFSDHDQGLDAIRIGHVHSLAVNTRLLDCTRAVHIYTLYTCILMSRWMRMAGVGPCVAVA